MLVINFAVTLPCLVLRGSVTRGLLQSKEAIDIFLLPPPVQFGITQNRQWNLR